MVAELLDAVASRCEVRRVADRLFGSIADTDTSQGIVVIAQRPAASLAELDVTAAEVPMVLFLKEINNPSNLGAIFRTAEAAGIEGVIVSTGRPTLSRQRPCVLRWARISGCRWSRACRLTRR